VNTAQVGGAVLVVLSAVVSFALLPQPDLTIPPLVKFVLGGLNVGLTTLALYLNVRMPGAPKP
jgi:hypothetical protein